MKRQTSRGYILVFVLLILLVLSLVVAALFVQAQELRSSTMAASNHTVAAANADRGIQEAIRALRNGDITVTGIVGTCPGGDNYRTCGVAAYVEPGIAVDGGILIITNSSVAADGGVLSPGEGGGLQFSYAIYRSSTVGSQPLNRYTIRATGYAGATETARNMVTSVVELEIEIGQTGFRCVNAYDCSGT